MNLEELKQRRDELVQDNAWMDNLIKEKEEKLWEVKVRTIAASELARSALESAVRSAGIVDTFMARIMERKGQNDTFRQ